MLFLLPPLALFLGHRVERALQSRRWIAIRRLAVAASFLVFAGAAIFNSAYWAREGYAAAAVVQFANANGLQGIDPETSSDVLTHAGYLLDKGRLAVHADLKQYELIAIGRSETRPGVIYQADLRVMGVVFKRFAVVKVHKPG